MKNRRRHRNAFTLIELLIVIALIAILAALLIPALHRARVSAQGAQCLSYKHQVTIAWTVYADDNEGFFAPNPFDNSGAWRVNPPEVPILLPWTRDMQHWDVSEEATNVALLISPEHSCLATYSKRAEIYTCPADTLVSPIQKSAGMSRRIRNVSMNCVLGNGFGGGGSDPGGGIAGFNRDQKFSDFRQNSPANRFVFIDEHPDSILDGPMVVLSPASYDDFTEFPSSLHSGGATLSFADAHAELKRWKLAETRRPVTFFQGAPPGETIQKDDFLWLSTRTGDPIKR